MCSVKSKCGWATNQQVVNNWSDMKVDIIEQVENMQLM